MNLRQVHVYKKEPGKNTYRLAEINPAMILSNAEEKVVLQRGEFFDMGGVRIKKAAIPQWLPDALKQCNPEALRECGYVLKEQAAS